MTESQSETIAALGEVWALSPDVRLGQLMAHLGFLGEVHIDKGLGTIEDDELIAILYRHRTELLKRQSGAKEFALSPMTTTVSLSGSSTVPETTPLR